MIYEVISLISSLFVAILVYSSSLVMMGEDRCMRQPTSWRDLLGMVIEESVTRQQLAEKLGVSPVTLSRWVKQDFKPRLANLYHLLLVLPEHRDQLLDLFKEEFPDFSLDSAQAAVALEYNVIPSDFYSRLVHTLAHTPKSLLFSLLCNLILEQALKQLDPYRLGLAIIIACCMPPSKEQKVRSLREKLGRGTPPWGVHLEQQAMLLGAESLAGRVVFSGHLEVNQHREGSARVSHSSRVPWEGSAAAPILYAGAVAGSLLVFSTQPHYFSSPRCKLIEQYAESVALAFAPHEFYEREDIELMPLPPYEVQLSYLSRFQHYMAEILTQAAQRGTPIHPLQAEQIAWQKVEERLLDVSFSYKKEEK